MKQRLGSYISKKISDETYKAYIPPNLPPQPEIDLKKLYGLLEKATIAIAKLNSRAKSIPNISLFIYMYVRKEALLSSQIEGTQSSFSDLILFEHHQKPSISLDDVEEVSNYVKAINYGLQRLKDGFPLSLRLLKEIHAILLSGGRGSMKLPGEFRRSQNWIGGTRPGNALFVPPPVENLADCLSNLEKFLHNNTLPMLIKAGIAHVQFETIHPFLDGNGRLGRLLIILLFVEGGIIDKPILYLSLYLKQNLTTYYDLLQEIRIHGTWEIWLEFFLEGVFITSNQAIKTAEDINNLFDKDSKKIATIGRARFSSEKVLDYLKQLPQVSVPFLAKELNLSAPTVRNSLNHMVKLGILEKVSNKQRNKIYVYKRYLNLLEDGAEPFVSR
jgi:Fic family protein